MNYKAHAETMADILKDMLDLVATGRLERQLPSITGRARSALKQYSGQSGETDREYDQRRRTEAGY